MSIILMFIVIIIEYWVSGRYSNSTFSVLSIDAVVEIALWHPRSMPFCNGLSNTGMISYHLGVYSAPAKTDVSISLSWGLVQKIRTVVNKILPKENSIINQQKFAEVIRK